MLDFTSTCSTRSSENVVELGISKLRLSLGVVYTRDGKEYRNHTI